MVHKNALIPIVRKFKVKFSKFSTIAACIFPFMIVRIKYASEQQKKKERPATA